MNRFQRFRGAIPAVLLLSLALVGSLPLQAADQGRLQGTVVDQNNKPVAGVKVTLSVPNSTFKQEKTTDAKGKFLFVVVDAARDYVVRFDKEGFISMQNPVNIPVNDMLRETFQLQPVPAGAGQPQQEPEAEMTEEEKAKAKELEAKSAAATTYNEGVQALNGGDTATATAKFKQASEIDPNLPEAHGALAELYLDAGQYDQALASVDRFLALSGEKPESKARGLLVRYDVLKAKKDPQALQALDDLAALGPNAEGAKRAFNYGAELLRADKNDDAAAQFNRAIQLDPNLPQPYVALGNIHLRKKNYKEAVATVDRLLAVQPRNLEALTLRYEALKASGDKAAAATAQTALKTASAGQSPQALYNQGVTLFNAGNPGEAKVALESALSADAKFAKAHYLLGLILAGENKPKEAKAHLQKFIEMAPNDPEASTAKEMIASLD
ncbi:MAG TPA: tetratricopeptide repeat protein [Thermoanaerobaculia bacterium]|nr:tetratricopeptide repeat protein [Thermoanaerobaculia bacterium]